MFDYLTLVPEGPIDAVRLYSGYARAVYAWAFLRHSFQTVGQYLVGSSPLAVRYRSLHFVARPGTGDLGYLTPSHKGAVADWFRPEHGQTVVDVGAHIGFFSVFAASRGARVFAFEPNPETFKILAMNVKRNPSQHVETFDVAVGRDPGVGTLYVPGTFTGSASLNRSLAEDVSSVIQQEVVRIARLDDVLGQGVRTVDWVLIDTEGNEVDVLQGAPKILERTRNVIIEVAIGSNQTICRRVLADEHGFRIINRRPQSHWNEYWLATRDLPKHD